MSVSYHNRPEPATELENWSDGGMKMFDIQVVDECSKTRGVARARKERTPTRACSSASESASMFFALI